MRQTTKHKPNPELIDAENPEWTAADMAHAVPFSGLPKSLQTKLRGAQKSPVKVPTTIRFDADVLANLKASGKGWQTRVNEAMRDWLKTHSTS
jgi:uncharacterized protein (DUF4415 family)